MVSSVTCLTVVCKLQQMEPGVRVEPWGSFHCPPLHPHQPSTMLAIHVLFSFHFDLIFSLFSVCVYGIAISHTRKTKNNWMMLSSTFVWVPGIQFRPSGLGNMSLYPRDHFSYPGLKVLLFNMFESPNCSILSLEDSCLGTPWDQSPEPHEPHAPSTGHSCPHYLGICHVSW